MQGCLLFIVLYLFFVVLFCSSDAYESGQMSLLKTYEDNFAAFKIPCFMAYGECGDPGKLEYRYSLSVFCIV